MIAVAKDVKMGFYDGGPIVPLRHFHVDRELYVKNIANVLESTTYCYMRINRPESPVSLSLLYVP